MILPKLDRIHKKFPKAQDLSGILASRTFQINMLAEILRLWSLKRIKFY